jgi:class 3 adenylate cyclase/tetratricopeptide (TPR) repeat protein
MEGTNMECPKCQFENRGGAKFCKKCGNRLELVCPSCGHTYEPDSVFCDECGYSLAGNKKAPPIDYNQPQSYTPKHLADKILTNRKTIEGERKLVTVLFADAVNYTAMSEKLDPEEVHQIMDRCLRVLIEQVHHYEGTINQFTGDGIMALFGAPIAHEDHAQRACHAGLAIQEALVGYTEKLKNSHGIDFNPRIGLNSGLVIVGAIGDDLQMDYTAIGDTVNLASRMESMATPGGVLVSENTHRLVRDFFEFKSLGKIEVKGKKEPQEAFGLIKAGEVETRIGASVAKGLTRFVGRKNSMSALLNASDKVKSGSGQVIGLVGEAGVGKSRLLLEMRNLLLQDEYSYIEGRCLQYGGSMAYLPALDILRSYFDIKEGDREFLIKKKMNEKIFSLDENLKRVIPPFQSLLSLKVDDEDFAELEPKQKRERTFETLRDMLVRGSQERPLILAIEDIHWIDKTSEEFIDYMIGWLTNTPILLILLYRPEYTHSWGSKSFYTKIGLDQLGTASSSELVKAMLEEGEVAPELRQLILNRSAGNPLFMEEFTHSLLDNGSIQRKDEQYVLSRKVSNIQVPDTIQGIIAARMDRLEDNLKRTMQVASVIGRDFAFRILQAITEMREGLKSSLLNLQGLEFIYEKRLFPELEYIFKHALTQEVAYNSLLLKRRKEIHAKIGGAIEALYPERLEEFYEMLAYHYSKGEDLKKAADYLKLSGIKTAGKYSPVEAFHYYQEALKVLKQMHESVDNKKARIEIIHLMYGPMMFLGQPEGSMEILQEGAKLSSEVGDKRSLATFYGYLAVHHHQKGEPLPGIEYGQKAFQTAVKIQDVGFIAATAFDLVNNYQNTGEYAKIVDTLGDVIELLEKNEMEDDLCGRPFTMYPVLCSYYGGAMASLGDFEEGIIFCEKGLRTANKANDPAALGLVELMYSNLYLERGDGQLTLDHAQNIKKYAEKTNWKMLLYGYWAMNSVGHHFLGDLKIALESSEKAIEIQKSMEVEFMLAFSYIGQANIYFDKGDHEKGLKLHEKALQLAQKNNEKAAEGFCKIMLGWMLGKVDPSNQHEAEVCVLKGIEILETLKLRPSYSLGYLNLGELYADSGQNEKAFENLKRAERLFQKMGMIYWLSKVREVLGRL